MAIVAPRNNEQDQDDIHELMEDVIGALFRGHQASLIERTELWAYNQDTGIWKELKTRGYIPDSYDVTRHGSRCVMSGKDSLILFGGNQLGNINISSVNTGNSAGVFVLSLSSMEWRRVPHPYQQTS